MSNADYDNDNRLRQDTAEKKDKENTNAGMIAAIITLLLGLFAAYLYYSYDVAPVPDGTSANPVLPTTATPAPTGTTATPATNAEQNATTSDNAVPAATTND